MTFDQLSNLAGTLDRRKMSAVRQQLQPRAGHTGGDRLRMRRRYRKVPDRADG